MSELILASILGVIFAVFATQNTGLVTITFLNNFLFQLPLYLIVLGSLLTGFIISWMFSLGEWANASLKIHNKNSELSSANKEVEDLKNKIHNLELENNSLRNNTGKVKIEDVSRIDYQRRSPIQKIIHRITN